MAAAFAVTAVVSLVTLLMGSVLMIRGGGSALLAAGLVALVLCTTAYAAAVYLETGAERRHYEIEDKLADMIHRMDEQIVLLRKLREHTMLSESAKSVVYRKEERKLIQAAFDEELARENWDEAVVLVDEMIRRFGASTDLSELRGKVESSRILASERDLDAQVAVLEEIISRGDWERAYQEAERISQTFPDSPRAMQLRSRVDEARLEAGHAIEEELRQSHADGDFTRAMELLKQLDHHLTESEAAPLADLARSVIAGFRDTVGEQFKTAVQNQDWSLAVNLGERIVEEFPSSKMAEEVRQLLVGLRAHLSEQQGSPTG